VSQSFDKNFFDAEYFEGSSKAGYRGQYEQIEGKEKQDRIANFIKTNLNTDGLVLDCGCAFGHLAAALCRLGVDAYGVDISEYSTSKPTAGAEGRISCQDITKGLSFPNRHFKTVVSIQTLEHIPLEQIPCTVKEICRLSDQFVYVEVPTWYDDNHPDRTDGPDKSHVSFYTASFWITEFHKNGFILDLNLSHKLMDTDSSRLIFYRVDNPPKRIVDEFVVTPVYSEEDLKRKWEDHYGHYEPRIAVGEKPLKILVISTSVFRVPLQGYGGLEMLAYEWAVEFHKRGHKVSLVAPEGSKLPDGIELIPMPLMEPEQQTFERYKNRLDQFNVIMDNTWLWYTVIAQLNSQKQLPIIHIYHSDPDYLQVPRPPIQYPCIVGLSRDHANRLSKKWGVQTRTVYNGIPLNYYTMDNTVQRNSRYLWLARYTPEKCPLETIRVARKCGAELDLYGNTMIVRDQNYINQCMMECDAHQVVFHNEATREETLGHYRTHKALIHLVDYNEAFGLVPVEAMACGTPVVVNRRGALPELVNDGVSGYIVNDWNQVEEIIKTGAVDKIKPEDCRKQAEKFSISKSAEGYLSLFRDVVEGRLW
jgi:glycosyltransferase involved in cell wall biosynthesis